MADIVYPPCFNIPDPCVCNGVDFTDPNNTAVIDRVKKDVAQLFYAATHGKYNCCVGTVYPCPQKPSCGNDDNIEYLTNDYFVLPYLNLETDVIKNCMPCRCSKSSCECETYPFIELPSGATEIVEVNIGGVNVYTGNESSFWLANNFLYTSLPDGFPTCNTLNTLSPDSWFVKFKRGYNPPEIALDILSRIVCERVKYCLGLPCSAPPMTARVMSVNGAEYVVDDTKLVWEYGLTGYHELDTWIVSDRGGLNRAFLHPRGVRRRSERKWL